MNWTKDEYIAVYGYFKKFGPSKKGEEYWKHLELFRRIQNRELENARNTFNMKLMNMEWYTKGFKNRESGLSKNKLFQMEIIQKEEEAIRLFQEMTINIDEIDVPNNLKDYKNQTTDGEVYDISIEGDFSEQNLAKASYHQIDLKEYLNDIKVGKYKVPLFQRKFVWTKTMIISFLNSLMKGFPFGSITVWQDKENTFESLRNDFVQEFTKNNPLPSSETFWLLDGQQRTTAIISQLVPNIKGRKKQKGIIFSFDIGEFKEKEPTDINYIDSSDLLNEDFRTHELNKKYQIQDMNASAMIEDFRQKILKTKIGVTVVKEANLNTAIDIFTEMNTTGKKLSLFDIVNAKWQTPEIGYDLEKFIKTWIKKPGRVYKPDELTITKAIYLSFNKENIQSKKIMAYKIPGDISEKMQKIETTLDLAHDFLINEMHFKAELMPSSNLIKFIAYLFSANNNQSLNSDQNTALKKYIKYVCMAKFYSSSTDQRVLDNINDMDMILKNDFTFLKESKIDEKDILNIDYNDGSSKYQYILNTLFKDAKSLANHSNIPVTSSNLSSSKINIHHIIPKGIKLDNKKIGDIKYGNSLANLAPILETENKKISNKYPSVYIDEFRETNTQITKTLKDLFINEQVALQINEKVNEQALKLFWKERARDIAFAINKDI